MLIHGAPLSRHLNFLATAQVVTCNRVLRLLNAFRRALVDHFAAVLAGARADVDEPVGLADRVLIVLDHNKRVA